MNAPLQAARAGTIAADATIAEVIGRYAAGFRYDDIPEAVREQARYMMLDAIGIACASTTFDFAHRARAAFAGLSDGTGATVIGAVAGLSLRDAVTMNSLLVHGLDFDDTYLPGGLHPTASCFPAALGVSEHLGATGRDLVAAYVLGMEVTNRLAGVARGVLNQCGLHPSSLFGGFAGAVVSGWLMGFNADQFTMAQGVALGMAGGTLESLQDGSWTKRLQPGWAAASGITAAHLARQGFVGSRAAYEGRAGLFAAHLGARVSECDYGAATRGLGDTWTLRQVALKPYPACHAAQAVIQAAIALIAETGLEPDDIESVTAVVPEWYVKLVCEPLDRKRRPDSAYGAQFSIPYAAACTLVKGRFGLAEIADAALRDPRVLDLAQRVDYAVGAQFSEPQTSSKAPAELVVRVSGGRTLTRLVDRLVGTPDRPMTHEEISRKFIDNATSVMSQHRAAALRDHILAVERWPSVRDAAVVLRT